MLPGNVLSTSLIFGDFLSPDNLPLSPEYSYQLGGVGIQNPTLGLQYQTWLAKLYNQNLASSYITLQAPNTPEFTYYSYPYISSISLAFDQNMFPFLAYTSATGAFFYWYDTTQLTYKNTPLPLGTSSVSCTFDDKRRLNTESGTTDIIVAYINNLNLYFRQERDRYTIEYFLAGPLAMYNPVIAKVGMCTTDRLLFQVNADLYG